MRISDWSSDVCSSDLAVVLGFYLLQVRAIHEIMARLDSLDSMLKDAEAMADEHSKAMARRDLEDSDGSRTAGNARPPGDRRCITPSQGRPAAERFPDPIYTASCAVAAMCGNSASNPWRCCPRQQTMTLAEAAGGER